ILFDLELTFKSRRRNCTRLSKVYDTFRHIGNVLLHKQIAYHSINEYESSTTECEDLINYMNANGINGAIECEKLENRQNNHNYGRRELSNNNTDPCKLKE
ncbi:hypothetical protein L9F63_011954, partial [Diploptera punctata]